MRAAVQDRYGPPEVVRVEDVPVPEPGPDELLVRVGATTVNRTDCGFRAGTPPVVRLFSGLRTPKARTLGCEFAGEVVDVGRGVDAFAVGDRVLGYCEGPFGAHAEYLAIGQDASIAAIPPGVDDLHAAPATEGAHYALAFLKWAGVEDGDDVLVYGAGGGIGSAAVQLLKARGCHVTAVCGHDQLDAVGSLGADRVVDRHAVDFTADTERYDAVVDAVGKSSYGACKQLLKPDGTYLSSELGRFAQNPLLSLATPRRCASRSRPTIRR